MGGGKIDSAKLAGSFWVGFGGAALLPSAAHHVMSSSLTQNLHTIL